MSAPKRQFPEEKKEAPLGFPRNNPFQPLLDQHVPVHCVAQISRVLIVGKFRVSARSRRGMGGRTPPRLARCNSRRFRCRNMSPIRGKNFTER